MAEREESREESRKESRDEMALRATLPAYAGDMVDTDAAWESVAPRLAKAGARMSPRRKAGPFAGVSRGLLVAASLAIVFALAGAGIGAAYWGGVFGGPKAQLIGDERLYTTIGQSQSQDGLTVTIDQAYADPGNTYIAITFTMPDAKAAKYTHVIPNHVNITDASGNQTDGMNIMCEPLWRDAVFHRDGVEHCLIDLGPFHPTGGQLSLRLEFGEIMLLSGGDPYVTQPGPWIFSFTLPFHKQSLGPGGPYVQPAATAPSNPGTKTP
jgi:hypothetical protein